MTAIVTKITFFEAGSQSPVANPHPDDPSSLGDSFLLVFVAPHLMMRTILRGFHEMVGGNPYWCGDGLAPDLQYNCGA